MTDQLLRPNALTGLYESLTRRAQAPIPENPRAPVSKAERKAQNAALARVGAFRRSLNIPVPAPAQNPPGYGPSPSDLAVRRAKSDNSLKREFPNVYWRNRRRFGFDSEG